MNTADSMRTFTAITGAVTDAHVKTLNVLPLAFTSWIHKYETSIDLDNQVVCYAISGITKKAEIEHESLRKIELSAQRILGGNWLVTFTLKKRDLYIGTRKKEKYGDDSTVNGDNQPAADS